MISCVTFSCASESTPYPMRFAGTCSAYSASAISQLTRIATTSGAVRKVERCPYQAIVMKMLEAKSSKHVCRAGESVGMPRVVPEHRRSDKPAKLAAPKGR